MANRWSLLYVLPWLLLSFDAAASDEIQLSKNCPPSFERHEDSTCRIVTLYDRYDSLQGQGVGGTQTALPSRRDGFSAEQIDLGRYLFLTRCFQPIRQFPARAVINPPGASAMVWVRVLALIIKRLTEAPRLYGIAPFCNACSGMPERTH